MLTRQEKYNFFCNTKKSLSNNEKKNHITLHISKGTQQQKENPWGKDLFKNTAVLTCLLSTNLDSAIPASLSSFLFFLCTSLSMYCFLFIHPLINFPSYQTFTRSVNTNQKYINILELTNTLENVTTIFHTSNMNVFQSPMYRVNYAMLCSRFKPEF